MNKFTMDKLEVVRIARKRGGLGWHYYVKSKGYTHPMTCKKGAYILASELAFLHGFASVKASAKIKIVSYL